VTTSKVEVVVTETRNSDLDKKLTIIKDEARRLEERNPNGYEKKLVE
jgi:hypothetical protein